MPAAIPRRRPKPHVSKRHMIDFGTGGLLVQARAGTPDVICRISTVVLEEHGATAGDAASSRAAYRRIAHGIQRAATRKHAAGDCRPDGLVFVGRTELY